MHPRPPLEVGSSLMPPPTHTACSARLATPTTPRSSQQAGPEEVPTRSLVLPSDRCRGAAVIAGAASFEAAGLDWTAGMADENLEEFEDGS